MTIEALIQKALKLHEKGLSEREICEDLHLSQQTVEWLLAKGLKREAPDGPPADVKIGWRTIGVMTHRMAAIAEIMADVILDEATKHDFIPETIGGTITNGVPLATLVAEQLEAELAVLRPDEQTLSGVFGSNYSSVENKQVVVVDDVVSSGDTMRAAINAVHEAKGQVVLCIALVNKKKRDDIDGIPLRALIRARALT